MLNKWLYGNGEKKYTGQKKSIFYIKSIIIFTNVFLWNILIIRSLCLLINCSSYVKILDCLMKIFKENSF